MSALLQRVQDLLRRSSSLSSWEVDFLESLETQIQASRKLSDRQVEKLEQIEEART